jgi:hypothetical protein
MFRGCLKATSRHGLFFSGQKLGDVWEGWKYKEGNNGNKDCYCGFDYEEPSPRRYSSRAVKSLLDACTNETAESAGQK